MGFLFVPDFGLNELWKAREDIGEWDYNFIFL